MSFSDEHTEMLFQRFVMEYYKQYHKELHPKAQQIEWDINDGQENSMIHFLPKMKTDISLNKTDKTLINGSMAFRNFCGQRDSFLV